MQRACLVAASCAVVLWGAACGSADLDGDALHTGGDGGAGSAPSTFEGGEGGEGADGATVGSGGQGGTVEPELDGDGDGISDALEDELAQAFFPYFSLDPDDGCPRHGVLYRLSPHPDDPSKLLIRYDVLFERDCGLTGHVGDNEVFSVLADPALPGPDGILAVRAISHQATLCEHVSTCGSLPGCAPCAVATRDGGVYPIVFSSRDKHGGYVDEQACDASVVCDFGGCTLGAPTSLPALVNAGEPGAPLVSDLTAQGFITSDDGWSEPELLHFDPWSGAEFGSAGEVADDLVDDAFVIDASGC
jgi:hypothetical protein